MRTKEEKRYIIINVILLLIILTLATYIYLIIRNNKEKIIDGYEQSVNVIISTLQVEKTNVEAGTLPSINVENESNASTSEKYDFSSIKNNRYYYAQLNENAKLIYLTIENNLDNMKSGTYEIKLPNEVATILEYENGEEMLDENFQSAWNALTLDRVDTFFIDVSKVSLAIVKTIYGRKITYSLTIQPKGSDGYLEAGLYNEQMVDAMLVKIKNVRDSIIQNVNGNTYNKILKVHDWIIQNLEYSEDIQNGNAYNLYGALIEKTAVCEGYAEALKYILDEMEIPCVLISGKATNNSGTTENHEWDYVKIDDKWYAVDATWDDPIINGYGYVSNSIKHKYFLVGSKLIEKNHTANGKITKNGQEFQYPYLETDDYK